VLVTPDVPFGLAPPRVMQREEDGGEGLLPVGKVRRPGWKGQCTDKRQQGREFHVRLVCFLLTSSSKGDGIRGL
jgi:hypothetical protein